MVLRVIVPVLAICIGVYIYLTQQTHPNDLNVSGNDASQRSVIPQLIEGFDRLMEKKKHPKCGAVAVGYNANLDLIVHGVEVMNALNLAANHPADSDHEMLSCVDEFHQTFSHFFAKGSAAERFVERGPFDQIVSAASSLESKQLFTGGNAALMASRFASEGCDVLLGGQVGSTLRTLLHPHIKVASQQGDSPAPNDKDEIHLIMEYAKGSRYGQLTAPRANRFITHSDTTNSMLTPMEHFHAILASYNPALLVISGLHLLEGQPAATRTQRIADLQGHLKSIPTKTKIHLELASVGDMHFMSQIVSEVVPRVDSLGLNEQELASVSISIAKGTPPDRDAFKSPSPRLVIDSLKNLIAYVDSQNVTGIDHPLTRIHFHCLSFHLIVQRSGSMWTWNAKEAVAWGSIATTKQACDFKKVDPDAVELPLHLHINDAISKSSDGSLDVTDPVWTWSSKGLDFFVSPVMVCKVPTKTVGLGDAISTVALIQQVFA